ncbi:TfpX/TfpZ family type IV pilin accessory protein [Variovorax paradoxus]|uniref:TfpX/TfpZ family type IV pilin accessory protein n=1 Tax=Variovorax paradoxus TaxID=34073 RepID=UPI0027D92FAC|nr:TfpX/TfpZ family type IV pilin accessory protein [Variovorax paradoxus]
MFNALVSFSVMNSRFRASGIHFLCSMLLALAALGVVYLVWYPVPLAAAIGVGHIFLILLAVDIVIGPLLTFVVYKKGKKSLFFDLTVIAILQGAAFAYGLHAIAVARPAWIVFNVDRFDLVQAHELDRRFLLDTDEAFRNPSWTGPRWVASQTPLDLQKRNQLILESAVGGGDLPQRPDLYVAIKQETENIRRMAHPLQELSRFNRPEVVNRLLQKWPKADAWLPLMAKTRPMTVLLNKKDGSFIAVVDLRPWN